MELNEMVTGIRSGSIAREKVIKYLFTQKKLRNGVKKVMNIGTYNDQDFNDIFNYSLVQFMKNILNNKDFQINSNVNSYIYGIARNLWLQKLKKRKRNSTEDIDNIDLQDVSPEIDLLIADDEKKHFLLTVLDRLGTKCKEVLMYWSANYKMKEIAQLLGYSSPSVVRKKKFTCMKELSTLIEINPSIKHRLSE